jgi:hypothetical protein
LRKKKTEEWWTVEILVVDYPRNYVRGNFSDGNKWVLGLGKIAWKFEGFTLKEEYVNFLKFRSIAPFPGVSEVVIEKGQGVIWQLQKKKFDPLAEPPE